MNINGMSTYQYYMQTHQKSSNAASGQSSTATSGTTASVEFSVDITVEDVTPAAPTVEDVKKEFAAFLDSLEITQRGTAISVSVSDSAWEKMAADPEYKQKMMDLCKRDLCDPAWDVKVPSPAVTNIRIDADAQEEYLASGYGSAYADKAKTANTGNSFWTRRTERHQAALEDMQRTANERREMMQYLQNRVDQRKQSSASGNGAGFTNPIASRYFPTATSGASSIFGSGSFL